MMTERWMRFAAAVVLALGMAGAAAAQEWRGMGRLAGKVLDENKKPIEGVTVRAALSEAGNQGPQSKTNRAGEWVVAGIARGNWALDFSKEGYETKSISVPVSEHTRIPPMEIVLEKAAPPPVDPNVEIKDKLTKAADLMNRKQFAEARAIYQELAAAYPDVKQFRPLLARAYYGEGNKPKAIEELRAASAADPDNVEVRLLLGNILMEEGQDDEGRQILESIDESKVSDPAVYINVGIGMINDGKQAEAIEWFDKAIGRFPDDPDAYYYRGISYLALGKQEEARADLRKYVSIAPPDAPERATAEKILESLR